MLFKIAGIKFIDVFLTRPKIHSLEAECQLDEMLTMIWPGTRR